MNKKNFVNKLPSPNRLAQYALKLLARISLWDVRNLIQMEPKCNNKLPFWQEYGCLTRWPWITERYFATSLSPSWTNANKFQRTVDLLQSDVIKLSFLMSPKFKMSNCQCRGVKQIKSIFLDKNTRETKLGAPLYCVVSRSHFFDKADFEQLYLV